jgi:hypothetical protein
MKYFIGIMFALLSVSAPAHSSDLPVLKAEKKTAIHHAFSGSAKKQMVMLNPNVFDDDDGNEFDDMDVQVPYRRPGLVDNSQLTNDEYIGLRLANSRRLALETYEKTWGSGNI